MPRYRYKCKNCDEEFMATHLWKDTLSECILCEGGEVAKLLTTPFKSVKTRPKKVGQTVKKYIEENREVLEELKEEAKSNKHD